MKKNYKSQNDEKLLIKEKGRMQQIEISDITHILCDGHITFVKTINKKTFSSYKLLKDYENELNNYNFFRSSRDVLVNLRNMKEYKSREKPTIILKDGTEIIISRRKLPEFIKRITSTAYV